MNWNGNVYDQAGERGRSMSAGALARRVVRAATRPSGLNGRPWTEQPRNARYMLCASSIAASLRQTANGVLTVTIPKSDRTPARRIEVEKQ